MRIVHIFRGVVAVMSALTTGIGITLDTLQITQLDLKWWTLISFVVFCVFVVWIIADFSSKNKELESKKPSITVNPEFIDDLWYLDVINNGEKGTFTAQLGVFPEEKLSPKRTAVPSRYDAVWASTNTNRTEIMNGHKDSILLARVKYTEDKQYVLVKAYDVATKSPYNMRHIEYEKFRDGMSFKLIIEAVISSDPSPRGGAFIGEYSIERNGITELPPQKRWSIPEKYIFGESDTEIGDGL